MTVEVDEDDEMRRTRAQTRSVYVSLAACDVAFCLFVSSFMGLALVQSSINGTVGVLGLGLLFLTTVPACLLLSPVVLSLLGPRNTLPVCMTCLLGWMASNFYPHPGLVMPTALVAGLANGLIGSAQASYHTAQALRVAQLRGVPQAPTVALVFGVFFCFMSSGTSLGCVLTSAVLQIERTPAHNSSLSRPLAECGANFCPGGAKSEHFMIRTTKEDLEFEYVTEKQVYILTGVHVSVAMAAIFLVLFFVAEPFQQQSTSQEEQAPNATARCRQLLDIARASLKDTLGQMKRRRQMFLVPLNIYVGISKSFMLADITQAFITCALGVTMIGYASFTYGLCACVAALTCGILVAKIGRIPIFISAYIIGMGTMVFLLLWTPDPAQWGIFYLIPALWAVPDAILASQINALYGLIFSDNTQGAFCTLKFLEGAGLVLGYLTNLSLCVRHKLYAMIALFSIGLLLYLVAEYAQQRRDITASNSSDGDEDVTDGSTSFSTVLFSADFSASEQTWRQFLNSKNEARPRRRIHFETSV